MSSLHVTLVIKHRETFYHLIYNLTPDSYLRRTANNPNPKFPGWIHILWLGTRPWQFSHSGVTDVNASHDFRIAPKSRTSGALPPPLTHVNFIEFHIIMCDEYVSHTNCKRRNKCANIFNNCNSRHIRPLTDNKATSVTQFKMWCPQQELYSITTAKG